MAKRYYPRCRVLLDVLLRGFGSEEGTSHGFKLVPVSAEIERNDLRTADTFSVELDYRDIPFDPRAIRQVHVAILMDDVGAHGAGPDGELREGRSDLQFLGYVDEPEMKLDDSAETVTFRGRDYTSLLLDYDWPGDEPVDVSRPLELVVYGLLQRVTGAEGLQVRFTSGAASTVLAERLGRTKFTPRGTNDSAWDVLVDLCGEIGLLPVIELDTLVIKRPGEFSGRVATFRYGENISRLQMKRKVATAEMRQVRVQCWDEQERTAREATYPAEPIVVRETRTPSGLVKKTAAPLVTFNVSGPWTEKALEEAARRIFEQGAMESFEGVLETREMEDASEGRVKLIRLGNGDHIVIRRLDLEQRYLEDWSQWTERSMMLKHFGVGDYGAIVESYEQLKARQRRVEQLETKFYVKRAKHRWSRDDGYALSLEFVHLFTNRGAEDG